VHRYTVISKYTKGNAEMSSKSTDDALHPTNVKCRFVDTASPIQIVLHNVQRRIPIELKYSP